MSEVPQSARVAVRITRRFSASAERVFDAWLDPERARLWLFATPTGQMVRTAIDARVGGSFCVVERRDGEEVEHVGEYLELERPRRLVFTLRVPKYSPEASVVAVDIAPVEGGCELTLTHERVPPPYAGRTEAGWASLLGGLSAVLEAPARESTESDSPSDVTRAT